MSSSIIALLVLCFILVAIVASEVVSVWKMYHGLNCEIDKLAQNIDKIRQTYQAMENTTFGVKGNSCFNQSLRNIALSEMYLDTARNHYNHKQYRLAKMSIAFGHERINEAYHNMMQILFPV